MSVIRRRLIVVLIFIGGLIFAGANFLRTVSDIKSAPVRLREISEMWLVHALTQPLVFSGLALALGALAYLGYKEDWLSQFRSLREAAGQAPVRSGTEALKFVHHPHEHDHFYGLIGESVEVRAVIANMLDEKTVNNVEIKLVRIKRLNRAGEYGQPYMELPRTLISDRGRECENIPPRREQSFRLCFKSEVDGKEMITVAPGAKDDNPRPFPVGTYFLFVKASGRDVLPVEQAYFVDATESQFFYKLCTPEDLTAPEKIPRMCVESG
ncbi:MAG: hypothetical protein ACRD2L_23320, partial [Terriglobia bacterium]